MEITEGSGCTWHPRDYWTCTKEVAGSVWSWTQLWGHDVLDIMAEFEGPIGFGSAATNAVWYAIEGDYTRAGLSLASAMPDFVIDDALRGIRKGVTLVEAAREKQHIARVTKEIRESVTQTG